jgi:hypothetical protein
MLYFKFFALKNKHFQSRKKPEPHTDSLLKRAPTEVTLSACFYAQKRLVRERFSIKEKLQDLWSVFLPSSYLCFHPDWSFPRLFEAKFVSFLTQMGRNMIEVREEKRESVQLEFCEWYIDLSS